VHPNAESLFGYLPSDSLVAIDDLSTLETMVDEVEEQALKMRLEAAADGSLPNDFPIPYLSWPELHDEIQDFPVIELGHSSAADAAGSQGPDALAERFGHDERFAGRLKPFAAHAAALQQGGARVWIVSRQAPRLKELLIDPTAEAPTASPGFVEASLSEGFVLRETANNGLHLITDSEIFGWERPQPRTRVRQGARTPESVYADLSPGDNVVHVDHGIGRFVGWQPRLYDTTRVSRSNTLTAPSTCRFIG
jgi:transcription-repair coupling factor (superfamily II helicase)